MQSFSRLIDVFFKTICILYISGIYMYLQYTTIEKYIIFIFTFLMITYKKEKLFDDFNV